MKIKVKYPLVMTVLIMCVSWGSLVYFDARVKEFIVLKLEETVANDCAEFCNDLGGIGFLDNIPDVLSLITQYINNTQVKHIILLNSGGNPHVFDDKADMDMIFDKSLNSRVSQYSDPLFLYNQDNLDYIYPLEIFSKNSSRDNIIIRFVYDFKQQNDLISGIRKQQLLHIYVVGFLTMALIGFAMFKIAARITRVAQEIRKIVHDAEDVTRLGSGDFLVRVKDSGKDEIGDLGRAFNWASQQLSISRQKIIDYSQDLEKLVNERTTELKAAQSQLVEAAHMAGMAEVASGVLHNIGNAINSVNVRLKLSEEKIDKLNVEKLAQAVDMLESNSGKLDRYIAEDPRGQNVFPYMKLALNSMAEQRTEALADIRFLDNQVKHICEIVSLQQSYAKGKRKPREEHRINDILIDAVRMQSDILERDGITVEVDCSYSTPILLDRLQLIQVFVNLIKNAAHSIVAQAPDRKVMQLSTRLAENGEGTSPMVEVVINDTGVGFSPDLKDKIFTYGFSTKKDGGKGFGLHYCANYLRSVGGSIYAESDGQGSGAQFIIKVPIEIPSNKKRGDKK